MLRLISEEVAPITRCKYVFEAEGVEMVVKPNTAKGSLGRARWGGLGDE